MNATPIRPDPAIVVIGDSLLDHEWRGTADRLCPDSAGPVIDIASMRTRAGGAALAAIAAAATGARTTLVTALGEDDAGNDVRARLLEENIDVVDLGLHGPTPEKIRLHVHRSVVARLDRGCATVAGCGPWSPQAEEVVEAADGLLVADYGRGLIEQQPVRTSIRRFGRRRPVVWDPHPRGPTPFSGTWVATPNRREAKACTGDLTSDDAVAGELAERWNCSIALTLGAEGVLLHEGGEHCRFGVEPSDGDACGAGDHFAAALTCALARGRNTRDATREAADAARAFVAGEIASAGEGSAHALVRRVRAAGGTVVAAGGCFDVLHAGHVSLLQYARSLGDCLVVCLNDDASVARLKGAGRPVNPAEDRAAVLLGLGCVDAVHVFGGASPVEALCELRPDIFVKGMDYADRRLPETDALATWGGKVVLAPLVDGRSTSRILARVVDVAGRVG